MYSDWSERYGGCKEDYFACMYLKNIGSSRPGKAQVVPVTWNELHKLNDEIGQADG
jgi:hypothetical protein